MKKSLSFITSGIIFLFVFFVYQGCKDPCKDVTCVNGTATESSDGKDCSCVCNVGYEGDDCGTAMTAKYVGTWNDNNTDDCAVSSYSVGITASSVTIDKILISNFGFYGCAGNWPTVEATVNGTQITIASQTFCSTDQYTVSGSGSINSSGTQITLTYSGTKPPSVGGGTYSCNVTFTKQ